MRINYNATAVIANNSLNQNDSKLADSIQRLSSGLKINQAKDNPAGLAIANRMNAQIRGLGAASNNTNDGISVVETADGALSEITAIIQRIGELANQAGNGVKTDEDREMLNAEVIQMKKEMERIAKDTEFNGLPLLDGTFDLKGYTDNAEVKVDSYSETVPMGEYSIDFTNLIQADGSVDLSKLSDFPTAGLAATVNSDMDMLTITASNDFTMKISADIANVTGNVKVDVTGIGAMKVQIGANEGQELAIIIPKISLKAMSIEDMDISTMDGAQKGIASAKEALSYVNSVRSRLGAYQNRMEHNSNSVDVTSENMTASYSRIMDVDMAEEMTEYSTMQVLSQSGVSMLAQANERPQQVLQLLQ